MAKKKVQAVSFENLKALVVNEAKQNGNILTQEQIDEYLMNYDLSDELAEELSKKYDVKVVGDAASPRRILDATAEAYRVINGL